MTHTQLLKTIMLPEYDFLETNPHLGKNIMFLTLGGSHAYGTNVEGSDVDIRGVALNSRQDLIGLSNFEQVIDNKTDTTVYAFRKFVGLISACNPNTIEMLGGRPENYVMLTPAGKLLLDNKKLFLSKRAVHSFGGYANAQLRRLQNGCAKEEVSEEQKALYTLESCQHAMDQLEEKHGMPRGFVTLSVAPNPMENGTPIIQTRYTSTCAELRIGTNMFSFNRLTVAELGYPEHVCFLISDDATKLVLQRCDKNQYSIPFCKIDELGNTEAKAVIIRNRPLAKSIRSRMGWEGNKTYVIPAIRYLDNGMLLFDLSVAKASIRGANLKRNQGNTDVLTAYPPVAQVLNSYRQVMLPAANK